MRQSAQRRSSVPTAREASMRAKTIHGNRALGPWHALSRIQRPCAFLLTPRIRNIFSKQRVQWLLKRPCSCTLPLRPWRYLHSLPLASQRSAPYAKTISFFDRKKYCQHCHLGFKDRSHTCKSKATTDYYGFEVNLFLLKNMNYSSLGSLVVPGYL